MNSKGLSLTLIVKTKTACIGQLNVVIRGAYVLSKVLSLSIIFLKPSLSVDDLG